MGRGFQKIKKGDFWRMSLFQYIEKLFEQTKNLNRRLSNLEIETDKLKKEIEG